jgi:SHS2 domain-containing protein
MVDWLNEVLYLLRRPAHRLPQFRVVSFRDHAIAAVGPRRAARSRAASRQPDRVKAVTWHQLKIEQRDGDLDR